MSARETAELLLLVGRLVQAEGYDGELSPAQWMALRFFARANSFSRTPSAFAELYFSGASTRSTSTNGPGLECLLFGVPIEPADSGLLCVHFQPTSEHRDAATVNEFTAAICWKQSAVEPDALWSIAITQLWNRPLISNMGTANRLPAAYRRPGVGDDLRRQ